MNIRAMLNDLRRELADVNQAIVALENTQTENVSAPAVPMIANRNGHKPSGRKRAASRQHLGAQVPQPKNDVGS